MSIGLGSVHCVLPERRVAVAELSDLSTLDSEAADFARGCGIDTVTVFDHGSTTDLAARACRELLAKEPAEPDVLLLVGARAPDVLLGSDAGRVQHEGGVRAGLTFTVDGLGCAGSSVGWGLARDLLVADPGRNTVLLAHASRPIAVDRVRFPVTVIGDGAFAMTLVRDGRPVLRAHRAETDGRFHDLFTVDYRETPWYEWREECASPDRYRFELALHSRQRLRRLVDGVLADAGATAADVRATAMQNVTAAAFEFYETLLGLPIHPVCKRNLATCGHLGAMDVVLNLDGILADGALAPGDLVLVINNSPVAAWTATLWEV
ncbi:3-oxoacyl-[acyl-carrier-protein] synthase III C-terminal domain-containing protein [Virgisporangium aurantiacum]|uniref:3-oxoacyl-ACP synthase n=1 Tax=Virgisporangium aurantiacum TaxID=175570 RepID=A0A8J4E2R1_9ACTN|nr:3-oxoacyl-[acyl-carrier-protein] synthase III C-terminal domain-containing protein [Virgisporangium aurantiacum]GIJ60115.1 3-oxoacyl-ACP synthase [Virgisporangium aurantiacum]